jgi:mRNA interferase RelE/StbE
MYRVVLATKATKDLKKLDRRYQKRIKSALRFLQLQPLGGKKLSGQHEGRYALRVWPYRIIYELNKKEEIVLIIRIGHRQGVYR